MELLIVIGIVAMLLCLLMFGVQAVRDSANRTYCANNLRQIGLAYKNYVLNNDNDPRKFPGLPGQSGMNVWVTSLLPYVENRLDVFLCPGAGAAAYATGSGTAGGTGGSSGSPSLPGGLGASPLGYIYVVQGNYNEFGNAGGGHDIPISWVGNDRMRLSPTVSPNPGPDGSIYLQMEDWTDWNWVDLQLKLTPTAGGWSISTTGPDRAPATTTICSTRTATRWSQLQASPADIRPPPRSCRDSTASPIRAAAAEPPYRSPRNSETTAGATPTTPSASRLRISGPATARRPRLRVQWNAIAQVFPSTSAPEAWPKYAAPRHRNVMNILLVNGSVRSVGMLDIDPRDQSLYPQYWLPNCIRDRSRSGSDPPRPSFCVASFAVSVLPCSAVGRQIGAAEARIAEREASRVSSPSRNIHRHLESVLRESSVEELRQRLRPDPSDPAAPVPRSRSESPESVARRWQLLAIPDDVRAAVADPATLASLDEYAGHIENCIGSVKVPVGLAGPLRIRGVHAHGDYYVPLATTESALVASYCRGSQLISDAGGCTSMLLSEGISRAPGFAFADLADVGAFVAWAIRQLDVFREKAEATTRFGKLLDMRVTVEGNHVYLNFEYTTEDAAGQNMVTFATQAICEHIEAESPVKPRYWFLEANLSGDKKASAQSFLQVRGKKVAAEVVLPAELIEKTLRTTPERMMQYWQMSALGGVQSGTIGVQGHYANGLAALYIACGQDAACVAESAVGVTRFEKLDDGSLYAAVTLPNLIVGTVGGGTGLPSQRACLSILGLSGPGHGPALAEVCAGLCLAGELSIIGAMCAGNFGRAHRLLARGRVKNGNRDGKSGGR